jgi:hypothetical protein
VLFCGHFGPNGQNYLHNQCFQFLPPFPPLQQFQATIRHAHEIASVKSFNLKKRFLKLNKTEEVMTVFVKRTHVRRIIS